MKPWASRQKSNKIRDVKGSNETEFAKDEMCEHGEGIGDPHGGESFEVECA